MYDIKPLINDISMKEISTLLEEFKSAKVYNKGQFIFRQGEIADCFYFLKSGSIRTYSTSPNGDERTIFILRKNGIFGTSSFFIEEIRHSFAVTLSKCEIISIDKEIVNKYIAVNPKFSLCIIQDMSRDINSLFDQISASSFLNAKQKVAFFIIKNIKNGYYFLDNNIMYLNFTQNDISKFLDLSRPTINKILSFFKSKNWIKTNYGSIAILNIQALNSLLL